jgi:hypothetical protein
MSGPQPPGQIDPGDADGKREAADPTDGETMTKPTMPKARRTLARKTDAQSPALHAADSHDLIRVHGARENNLKDNGHSVKISVPKLCP